MGAHSIRGPKGLSPMTSQGKLAMLVAGVAVAAGVSAPVAAALPNCQTVGGTSTCRTSGSVSIKARPGNTAAPANRAQIPWFITDPRINPNR